MQIQLAGQVQNDDTDASELCGVIKKLEPILGCGQITLQSDTKPCILMFEGATQQPGERSPPMISQLLMLPEALIFACSLKYSDVALPPHDLTKTLAR